MLSKDDLDIAALNDGELAAAWDLWFDLAQSTNEGDPPYMHGVLAGLRQEEEATGRSKTRSGKTRTPPE